MLERLVMTRGVPFVCVCLLVWVGLGTPVEAGEPKALKSTSRSTASVDLSSEVRRGGDTYVGAMVAADSRSLVMAVCDPGVSQTRLLFVDDGAISRVTELPGVLVSRLTVKQLDGVTRVFVGGAVGAGDSKRYGYRLYDLGGSAPKLVWDSVALPWGEPRFVTSDRDLDHWAAVDTVGDDEIAVRIGSFAENGTIAELELSSSWLGPEDEAPDPGGISSDFPSSRLLRCDPEGGFVCVVLWQGVIYVIADEEPGVLATVRPQSSEVGGLYWQPQQRRLWVHHGDGLSAYNLENVGGSAGPDKLETEVLLGRELLGFVPEAVQPLSDGRVLVSGRVAADEKRLKILDPTRRSPSVVEELELPVRAVVAAGPEAEQLFVLPDGMTSDELLIATRTQ